MGVVPLLRSSDGRRETVQRQTSLLPLMLSYWNQAVHPELIQKLEACSSVFRAGLDNIADLKGLATGALILRPMRYARPIRICRSRKIGPVCFHRIRLRQILRRRHSGAIEWIWDKVAKDVVHLGRMCCDWGVCRSE